MFGAWEQADDLQELAGILIGKYYGLSHIDIDDILFARETETTPKAYAKTYSMSQHPIQLYCRKSFAIVFFEQSCELLTARQRAILMFHELMHIPESGFKLVQHDVKDFYAALRLGGIDWARPGAEVPDILGGDQ